MAPSKAVVDKDPRPLWFRDSGLGFRDWGGHFWAPARVRVNYRLRVCGA